MMRVMTRRNIVVSVLIIAGMLSLALVIALAPVGRDGRVMGWTAAVLFLPLLVFVVGFVMNLAPQRRDPEPPARS
jgi:hypothetical protein